MTCSKQRFGTNNPAYKHGMTGTVIHRIWLGMLNRCRDMKNHLYGGRGIRVCDRWKVFEHFCADMGERPDGMQLERVDNDGPYSPENCRWASRKEQAFNRRTTRPAVIDGETLTRKDAAAKLGLAHCTISARVRYGFTGDELLRPRMRAPHKRISDEDKQWVREWHAAGWPQKYLAHAIGTNSCRISWIVNGDNSRRAKLARGEIKE